MPSRLGPRSGSATVQQIPRQVKKVSVPIIPDISTQKYGTCQKNMATEDLYRLKPSVILQQRNGLLESKKYGKNTKSLSNVLHVPSTSTTTLMVPSSLCFKNDSYSIHSPFNSRNDCCMHSGMNLEMKCQRNLNTASPFSSTDLKQQSFYGGEQNSDGLLYSGCHRNSADSSSSHDSSSGFGSVKSGSSHGSIIDAQGSISTNSLFSKISFIVCGSSSGLLLRSSQSRLSMQSNSSGDASLIINNITSMFDDSAAVEHFHGDNLKDISRLSFSDMMLKGVQEAEILSLWLDSLGYPEYSTAFLTQGYDLSTIARITPEDLTALGITHPIHRKLLISDIHKWRITDTWPTLVPSGKLRDWLPLIGLPEYITLFENEGYCTVSEIQNFTWEDFEDIGIKKLGHLKRLGLAIKKMKGHKFDRNQSNSDLHQLVSVAVHHNKIDAQANYDDLLSQLSAPLAQICTFCPANLGILCDNCYSTGKQCLHFCEDSSAKLHAQKQKILMYPHYQSSIANDMVSNHFQRCDQRSLECGLNKRRKSSLQMNLYSLSQILSDGSLQKHSVIREQSSMFPTKILSAADNLISSDSEDYPPPLPAPLACEGSIQLLKSAFNESAMAATTESGIANSSNFQQHYNEINSSSLNEQFSFTKNNCDGLSLGHKYNEEPASSSFSQSNACRSQSISARNGDVLNDMGSLLQNLTDDLDAMLLPSQSNRYSCGRQIPF